MNTRPQNCPMLSQDENLCLQSPFSGCAMICFSSLSSLTGPAESLNFLTLKPFGKIKEERP